MQGCNICCFFLLPQTIVRGFCFRRLYTITQGHTAVGPAAHSGTTSSLVQFYTGQKSLVTCFRILYHSVEMYSQ